MNGLGKPLRRKSGPEIERTVKIKVNLPHVKKKIISRRLEPRALVPEDELELPKASQKYTRTHLDPSSADQLCHSAYFQRTLFHQFSESIQ